MSTECTIRFDNNPHGVYYSGQLVSGACELVTTKQKTIRGWSSLTENMRDREIERFTYFREIQSVIKDNTYKCYI